MKHFLQIKFLNKTPKDGREKEEFQHYRMFWFFYIKLPEQDILALF